MIPYEAFRAEVERRKRERWLTILVSEPRGRAIGRRPRDPLKERLLARLDAEQLKRRAAGDPRAQEPPG